MNTNFQTLRVASYNVRKAVGLDRRRDPRRILEVINGLGADVVALQEADRRLGKRPTALPRDMIAHETDFVVAPLAVNSKSLGWHGNAVLLRKSLRLSAVHRISLPGLEPRGAVRLDLDLGAPASIVATHLGLTRRHRKRQLSTLRDHLEDADDAIILGDFNEWSPHRGLEALEGYDVHAPGSSYHAARPIAALDRIALTQSLFLKNAGVEQGPLARRASDHLPIWADVALPGHFENNTGSVAPLNSSRVAAPMVKS